MAKEFLERGGWSLLKSEKMGEVGPRRGVWLPGRAAAFREPPAKKPNREGLISEWVWGCWEKCGDGARWWTQEVVRLRNLCLFFFFFKVEGDLGMFTDGEEASVEEGLKVQNTWQRSPSPLHALCADLAVLLNCWNTFRAQVFHHLMSIVLIFVCLTMGSYEYLWG